MGIAEGPVAEHVRVGWDTFPLYVKKCSLMIEPCDYKSFMPKNVTSGSYMVGSQGIHFLSLCCCIFSKFSK